jgi:hypothetical protein
MVGWTIPIIPFGTSVQLVTTVKAIAAVDITLSVSIPAVQLSVPI